MGCISWLSGLAQLCLRNTNDAPSFDSTTKTVCGACPAVSADPGITFACNSTTTPACGACPAVSADPE
eukprot:15685546-Heterocapsa_arctica.AAC.1